jgi:dihydroorotase-like cyclic amidohydrolase
VVPGVQHLSYDRPTCQTLAAAIAAAGGVLHVIDMPAARPTLRTPRTEWIQ